MATVKQIQDAARFYVDLGGTRVIGCYETDEGMWVNVYYTDPAEKIALETDLFGSVLLPDETQSVNSIPIETYKRRYLS